MKKDNSLLLGIDIGTTDTKCSVYDLRGNVISNAMREYPMILPQAGWVEEDPEEWWNATKNCVHQCISSDSIANNIAAIGISCTNSFIPVDKSGNALYNAILQIDQRTTKETEWILNNIGEEKIFDITCNRIARGTFSLPTLLWFKNNRPDIYSRTYKFLTPSGYIVQKLTNEYSISESRMCFTQLANTRTGKWDEDLIRISGINKDLLPNPSKAYDIVGHVSSGAAHLTGLRIGTPVVGGAMDTVAAAVGAGAVKDGDIFLAVGTCGRFCYTSEKDVFNRSLMNCRNAFPGQWLSIGATNAAGASLRWFRDKFENEIMAFDLSTKSLYNNINKMAEEAPAGAGGLIYLPYLAGERYPIWNSDAKGVLLGLSLSTNISHIARAIMEGVAFSLRQGMDIVRANGLTDNSISMGGGIANSRIWCQIFADVFGHPIVKLPISETETLGGAILAGYAVGLISNPGLFAKRIYDKGEIVEPDLTKKSTYDDYYAIYNNASTSLEKVFSQMALVRSKEAEEGDYHS